MKDSMSTYCILAFVLWIWFELKWMVKRIAKRHVLTLFE